MIPFEDLVEREHEPLRCIGYVLQALARKFPDFHTSEIPSTQEEAELWLSQHIPHRWHEIGRNATLATRDGDVLYCSGGPDGAFVAVLVDEKGGGFLTSNKKRGSHIRPRRTLTSVISVQRRS